MQTLAFIQNFGITEWIIILVIVLLLFGHRLPGVGKALGRSVGEFKTGLKEGQQEADKAGQSAEQKTDQQAAAPKAPEAEKKA